MRIINNVTDLLGEDLKAEISPGSKVRIAASTFSIFAFEALRNELEQVDELEFIFTSPAFVTEKGSVAKIVKLEHAWRRLDGRNDDGFQVAPFPG
ncbi:hypothetical protein [Leucobacter luti]|uniref:hypothetical protein n=1 Tax=Leucobacter luti TaxID=340320 RepID=UPI003D08835E